MEIKYKINKKLKEAGFPDSEEWEERTSYGDTFFAFGGSYHDEEYPQTDLSSLIEACGDGFKGLLSPVVLGIDGWLAIIDLPEIKRTKKDEPNNYLNFCYGKFISGNTPEEAVANLWIKLNEK